jgi:hypothetical protein
MPVAPGILGICALSPMRSRRCPHGRKRNKQTSSARLPVHASQSHLSRGIRRQCLHSHSCDPPCLVGGSSALVFSGLPRAYLPLLFVADFRSDCLAASSLSAASFASLRARKRAVRSWIACSAACCSVSALRPSLFHFCSCLNRALASLRFSLLAMRMVSSGRRF